MLASCSSSSLTCEDLKCFLTVKYEATVIRIPHYMYIFGLWLIGMCKNQLQRHANVWWLRAGNIKVKEMNTSEQVLLNIFILCFLSFAMMDYAPQASSVPATLFVAAGNTMERLASGNGRAVKCKSVCERHPVFVLLEQMDVGSEPKVNFSHRQKEQIKPNVLFFLPSGTHI